MQRITPFCILICSLLFTATLNSQTTEDLFSLPGLNINSYHSNFYHGISSSSYTFMEKTERCGMTVLRYVHHTSGTDSYLYVDGAKVYAVYGSNCG